LQPYDKILDNKTRTVTFTLNRILLENVDYFNRWLLKSLHEAGDKITDNLNPKDMIFDYLPRNDYFTKQEFHVKNWEKVNYQFTDRDRKKIKNPFEEESYLENFKTENCLICQNKEYVDHDYGIPICQTCLYRRNLFLYGSNLECTKCEIKLNDDNFHGWLGESWCKRCCEKQVRELNPTDGKKPGTVIRPTCMT